MKNFKKNLIFQKLFFFNFSDDNLVRYGRHQRPIRTRISSDFGLKNFQKNFWNFEIFSKILNKKSDDIIVWSGRYYRPLRTILPSSIKITGRKLRPIWTMISSDLDEDVVRFWPKMGQKSSKRAIRKRFSTAGLSNNYHSNEGKKTENPRLCKKFSRKLAASNQE